MSKQKLNCGVNLVYNGAPTIYKIENIEDGSSISLCYDVHDTDCTAITFQNEGEVIYISLNTDNLIEVLNKIKLEEKLNES